MANSLRYVGKVYTGDLAPVAGDDLNEYFGSFPVGTIYASRQTNKVYVRNTSNANASDWSEQAGIASINMSDGFINFEAEA